MLNERRKARDDKRLVQVGRFYSFTGTVFLFGGLFFRTEAVLFVRTGDSSKRNTTQPQLRQLQYNTTPQPFRLMAF